ncbi:MAG: NfeD family protein [Treponema sp.]|nr:NfeD family protein [Treponema sp.]
MIKLCTCVLTYWRNENNINKTSKFRVSLIKSFYNFFRQSKIDPVLIGKIAITNNELQPRGTVIIDNEIFDAEAEEGYIEAGRGVRVTRIRCRKMFVRRV